MFTGGEMSQTRGLEFQVAPKATRKSLLHNGSFLFVSCLIFYLFLQNPLGGLGNGDPVVRLPERRGAVGPASSCGGAG